MKHRVSSRLRIKPLPALLAACSRLMRWRSTNICLSSVDKLSIVSEKASFISGKASTVGRINSRTRIRSGFLAQPGKDASLRLRARRTRLDITMRSKGPLRRAMSAGGMRKSCMPMVSGHGGIGEPGSSLFDFVAQDGGFLEIFIFDGLAKFLWQELEALRQIAAVAQGFGDLADVAGAFVHGFEQPFQGLGESVITFRASESAGFLEIRLAETATAALELSATACL